MRKDSTTKLGRVVEINQEGDVSVIVSGREMGYLGS